MQPLLHRKFNPVLFSNASFGMKQPAAGGGSASRKGGNLPLFVVVFSIFVFGCFMYNEDVKSIAEFPFSSRNVDQEMQGNGSNVQISGQTATVSVVMNARTVVETEVEAAHSSSDDDNHRTDTIKDEEEPEEKPQKIEMAAEEDGGGDEELEIPPQECDLFTGNWVFDNVSHPVYKEEECEFLTAQVTCMRNGRESSLYQNWRWKPRDCNLPKFKQRLLIEKLRNKRLMFVGDSLNRNQWESMICFVQSAAAPGRKSLVKNGSLSVFRMEDYNATVEFYWAPFWRSRIRMTRQRIAY